MINKNVTIMMVTYNRLELTKRMVSNLLVSTKLPFNFVIVDNGSSDGTVNYLKDIKNLYDVATMQQSVLHLNSTNRGIAIGRNQALRIADELKTDWYCTIDNDVEVPGGWLEECIAIMESNKKYGMLGVNMEDKSYPLVTLNGHTFQHKQQGNLGTACMVFPKQLHQMLGFFNTEYGIYGEEDADFGMRGRVIGFNLGYIKEMGTHFGIGEHDTGEYRKFKDISHNKNLAKFNANCAAYVRGQKPIYLPYKD